MHASRATREDIPVPPESDREQFASPMASDQPGDTASRPSFGEQKEPLFSVLLGTPLLPLLGMALIAIADRLIDRALGVNTGTSLLMVVPMFLAVKFGGPKIGMLVAAGGFLLWLVFDAFALSPPPLPSPPFATLGSHVALFAAAVALAMEHRRLLAERAVATTDFLTGVANRRGFYETLTREIERSRRYQTPMTLLYLDCDEFKAVNDRHGHSAGNRLLVRIAATLRENTRAMDVVGRLGGDEFAVLLVETHAARGTEVAARLQREMGSALGPDSPGVTFSIGVMTFDSPPDSPTEALRVADALMYEAKRAGKDRVVHAMAG